MEPHLVVKGLNTSVVQHDYLAVCSNAVLLQLQWHLFEVKFL